MQPAAEFINSLSDKARKKVVYNINRVKNGEKDKELFKKLDSTEIWEFRTIFNGTKYRLFSFWDTEQNTLVVATNGFIKKTQKAPHKEIEKAQALMKEYFNNKNKN